MNLQTFWMSRWRPCSSFNFENNNCFDEWRLVRYDARQRAHIWTVRRPVADANCKEKRIQFNCTSELSASSFLSQGSIPPATVEWLQALWQGTRQCESERRLTTGPMYKHTFDFLRMKSEILLKLQWWHWLNLLSRLWFECITCLFTRARARTCTFSLLQLNVFGSPDIFRRSRGIVLVGFCKNQHILDFVPYFGCKWRRWGMISTTREVRKQNIRRALPFVPTRSDAAVSDRSTC